MNDKQLMKELKIDNKTLNMFKEVRAKAIKEAKLMGLKKNKKFKVLGISGSARSSSDMAQESSNSEELLRRCLNYCKKLGAEIELIPLKDYKIEHCKACYSTTNTQCHFYCSCYPKGTPLADDMSNILYDKVISADAIIFATPVNNFKISTLMAAFIDRCISLDGSLSPANPKDPKNNRSGPWTTGNYSYAYGYNTASFPGKYDLVTQFEDVNNNNRCELKLWRYHTNGNEALWCGSYSKYLYADH